MWEITESDFSWLVCYWCIREASVASDLQVAIADSDVYEIAWLLLISELIRRRLILFEQRLCTDSFRLADWFSDARLIRTTNWLWLFFCENFVVSFERLWGHLRQRIRETLRLNRGQVRGQFQKFSLGTVSELVIWQLFVVRKRYCYSLRILKSKSTSVS